MELHVPKCVHSDVAKSNARVDGKDITRLSLSGKPAPDAFLVIGVDHSGQSQALCEAGADVVVITLAQVKVTVEPPSAWSLVYKGFDPTREGIREALCALRKFSFILRAACPQTPCKDGIHPRSYEHGPLPWFDRHKNQKGIAPTQQNTLRF